MTRKIHHSKITVIICATRAKRMNMNNLKVGRSSAASVNMTRCTTWSPQTHRNGSGTFPHWSNPHRKQFTHRYTHRCASRTSHRWLESTCAQSIERQGQATWNFICWCVCDMSYNPGGGGHNIPPCLEHGGDSDVSLWGEQEKNRWNSYSTSLDLDTRRRVAIQNPYP